jgi:hypothetical protein
LGRWKCGKKVGGNAGKMEAKKDNGHRVSFREEGGKRMGIMGKGKWGTKKVNEKM